MKEPIEEIQMVNKGNNTERKSLLLLSPISLRKRKKKVSYGNLRHLSNVGFNWLKEAHQPQRWASSSKLRTEQTRNALSHLKRQTLVGKFGLINPGTKSELVQLLQLSIFLPLKHSIVQKPKPSCHSNKNQGR